MAAYNGAVLNNGTPTDGISDSGTFLFTVMGTGLDTLNEASFLSLYSGPPAKGGGVQQFVVRWQDLGDGSGFALPGVGIPEPATMSLMAFVGLALLRRRQQ